MILFFIKIATLLDLFLTLLPEYRLHIFFISKSDYYCHFSFEFFLGCLLVDISSCEKRGKKCQFFFLSFSTSSFFEIYFQDWFNSKMFCWKRWPKNTLNVKQKSFGLNTSVCFNWRRIDHYWNFNTSLQYRNIANQ